MSSLKFKQRVGRILEVLATTLLLGTQTILNAGVAISIMTIPLLPYVAYLLTGRYPLSVLAEEIWVMTFASAFIVGRIVSLIGITVLLIAAAQWIINHRKKNWTIQNRFIWKSQASTIHRNNYYNNGINNNGFN